MTASVAGIHLTGIHSARPAGNTVPDGSLYSCTTHSLIYQSSYGGNSWSTWATLGTSSTTVATDPIFDAKGDLPAGTGADTAAKLTVGTNGFILAADSGQTTGLRWLEHRFCKKVADESLSSVSYADSTNMGLAVSANKTYKFRFVIFYSTNASTVGIKLALNGPAGTLCYAGINAGLLASTAAAGGAIYNAVVASADISTDMPVMEATNGPAGSTSMAVIEGWLTTINAGTLKLRHASETATATTIATFSHGELTEIV